MFGWSFSHFKMWFFKTFQHTQGIRLSEGSMYFSWQCACMYVNIPLCRRMLTTWVSSCLWTKWWRGRSSHWSTKCQRYWTHLYYQLIQNIQLKFSLLKISDASKTALLSVTVRFASDSSEVTPAFGDSGTMDQWDSSSWPALTLW